MVILQDVTVVVGAPGIKTVFTIGVNLGTVISTLAFQLQSIDAITYEDLMPFGHALTNSSKAVKKFGYGLAYGDVNLDGVKDLLVSDNSSIYILYYNKSADITSIDQVNKLDKNITSFGRGLDLLGDLNGDGSVEIVSSASFGLNRNENSTDQLTLFNLDGYNCPTMSPTLAPTVTPDNVLALKQLYWSTNGENWVYKNRWMTGHPCLDEWENVDCDGENEPIFFQFSGNNLDGTLPSELALMTKLSGFSIFGEPLLAGSIPSQLGSLNSLSIFYVGNTSIGGSIPSQLGSATNLDFFLAMFNNFSGNIPSQLGMIGSSANILVLVESSLTGSIPSQLGLLQIASTVALIASQVSGSIPSQLGLLTQLEEFM
jgi:hypothetical protein